MMRKKKAASEKEPVLYQGTMYWVEVVRLAGSSATIDRAILRENELVLEFKQFGATYYVNLRRQNNREFIGRWEAGGPRSKRGDKAECRLINDGRNALLTGTWIEEGEFKWFGELKRVGAFVGD